MSRHLGLRLLLPSKRCLLQYLGELALALEALVLIHANGECLLVYRKSPVRLVDALRMRVSIVVQWARSCFVVGMYFMTAAQSSNVVQCAHNIEIEYTQNENCYCYFWGCVRICCRAGRIGLCERLIN